MKESTTKTANLQVNRARKRIVRSRLGPLWLVLAVFLLCTNLLGARLFVQWRTLSKGWISRTDEVLELVNNSVNIVREAESARNLALLRNEPSLLKQYRRSKNDLVNEILPELDELTRDIPSQRENSARFTKAIRLRLDSLEEVLPSFERGDTSAILPALEKSEFERLQGGIRHLAQQVIKEQDRLRTARDDEFARSLWNYLALIIGCSVMLSIFLVVAIRRVRRELTLRKQAEELAQESERLEHARAVELQTLLDTVPAVVLISKDTESRAMSGSREAYALLKLASGANASKTAIVGPPKHYRVFRNGHELSPAELPLQYAARTGKAVRDTDLEVVFDDGTMLHLFGSVEPLFDEDGNPRGSIAAFTDVTQRREADLLLKASEARWKLSLETGQLGFFEYDYEQNSTRWNESEYRLIDLEPGTIPPSPEAFFERVHPEDRERLIAEWNESLKSGRYDTEFRIVRSDGEIRWLVGKGTVIEDALGRKRWFTGVNIDITKAKRIEAELSQAVRERTEALNTWNAFMATAPIGIAVIDHDARCRFMNQVLAQIIGDTVENQIGKTFEERVPGLAPVLRGRFTEVLNTGRSIREVELEGDSPARPGDRRTFLESWFPIIGGDGEISAVGVVVQDMTERKRAAIELAHHRDKLQELVDTRTRELSESMKRLHMTERLAALGTLAAGLGHDLANLVLPIRARLESLSLSASTPEMRDDIVAIGQALDHLSNLSAGMRLMALDPTRPRAASDATDLSVWWTEAQGVFRGVLPRHVGLEGTIGAGLGVSLPRHQLLQAIFNLVQNAGEVLAENGDGLVRIEAIPDPGAADSFVLIKVSDNGPGMSEEVKARCFEPYFSTKGRAISTGMGLSLVRGLVDSVKGSVAVESKPGRGTTFVVRLPRRSPVDHMLPRGGAAVRSAAISISEPRQAALATMIAERLDVKVESLGERGTPTSEVWITDAAPRGAIERFLSEGEEHRVIYLGSRSFDPGSIDEHGEYHGRIVALPARPGPTVLRDAITRLIEGNGEAAA